MEKKRLKELERKLTAKNKTNNNLVHFS